MRSYLAAAFLLLGLPSAPPQPESAWRIGSNLRAAAGGGPPSLFEIESATRRSDRLAGAISPASASVQEMPHLDAIDLPIEPISLATGSGQQASLGDLCDALFTAAHDNGLPVPFFANLIWQESRLRDDAVSPVGALGIAQFMPEVAHETGLDDPFDPQQAIPASARFLRELRTQFGNLGFVAAAYNAGAHRVSEWLANDRALPHETLNYVLRVTGRSAEQWRTTPPTDSTLAFAEELPCRAMPAFADIEQTQMQQAQVEQPAVPQAKPPDAAKTAPVPAKADSGTGQKLSLAKAWAKELGVADADDAGGHRTRRQRQASRVKSKDAREARLSGKRVALHRAATHHA
jgi:hypothetical protein